MNMCREQYEMGLRINSKHLLSFCTQQVAVTMSGKLDAHVHTCHLFGWHTYSNTILV